MASAKAIELASIRPRKSYLGDYAHVENLQPTKRRRQYVSGYCRAFSPGAIIHSRDGVTSYRVAPAGNFIRIS